MIDISARQQAENAISQFINGEVDNDDFEALYPVSKIDRGIYAIEAVMWHYYSDHRVEKLPGQLPNNARALVDRCLLFLASKQEYVYAQDQFYSRSSFIDADPFSEDSVWPFFTREEYERAKSAR